MICIIELNAKKEEKHWARIYSDGKFGIIGKSGAVLIKPEYDMIGKREGKMLPVFKDAELYSITDKGQRAPFTYELKGDPRPFYDNAGKWGLKNKRDEELLPPTYDFIGKFENGVAKVFKDGKMGLINEKGQIVMPPTYDYIFDFDKNNRAVVLSEFKHGIINEKGSEIIPPMYNIIQKIEGENYLVLRDTLWGVVNKNGHENVPPMYQGIFKCKEGYKTLLDGKTGMLTKEGDVMFEPSYDFVTALDNKTYIVIQNGLYGLLNKSGKQLIPPRYQFINQFEDDRAFVMKDNLWGIINSEGVELVAPLYNSIEKTKDNNLYSVWLNAKQGLIDKDGRVVVKPSYDDISIF